MRCPVVSNAIWRIASFERFSIALISFSSSFLFRKRQECSRLHRSKEVDLDSAVVAENCLVIVARCLRYFPF